MHLFPVRETIYERKYHRNIPIAKLVASKYLAILNYLAIGNRERK
jgi:hypothetical protein